MKKHQINLIKAIPTPNQKKWGYKPNTLNKSFIDGVAHTNIPAKWYEQKIHGWNNLEELSKILTPYIEGQIKDWEYTALMLGQFDINHKTENGFQRKNDFVEDTPHKYFILDIETDAPNYGDICTDLNKVRDWLIQTYPWINEDTGMFLHFTASAGMIQYNKEGRDLLKHKQVRVRAIMEHSCLTPLAEDERDHALRPYLKQMKDDHWRHIDRGTNEKARILYLAPPFTNKPELNIIESRHRTLLVLGNPIEYELLRSHDYPGQTLEGADGTSSTREKRPSALSHRKKIREKTLEQLYEDIGDGWRYNGQFDLLLEAFRRDEDVEAWKQKILNDKHKLGDWTEEELDSRIKYIEESNSIKDFNKPTDLIQNHNVIDIPTYLLKDWDENIAWEDKGVILQKLYEGAGKTVSLKELRKTYPHKSFLYIAPNTKPIIEACRELGLELYTDHGKTVGDLTEENTPFLPLLGICYPSLEYMKEEDVGFFDDIENLKQGLKWDIVVLDEIEQLLTFAVDGGGCINNPSLANNIIRQLIEKAELVVGMDARISNLSLQTLETWRMKETFDIYTQSKVKPFNKHHFTFVDSTQRSLEYVRKAVNEGKKVAIVSELQRTGKGKNLEKLRRYIEEATGKPGFAIDRDNKDHQESKNIINRPGYLQDKLATGELSHLWVSPVLQSAWSYLSDETPFDLVVGIYPNSVLTAPNIIQHIKRFRQSTQFVMYINQHQKWINEQLYKKMYPPQELTRDILEYREFNVRHKLSDHWEKIQLSNRHIHFIDEIVKRGATYEIDSSIFESDLYTFMKKHQEELVEYFRSPQAFNRYKKLEEATEGIYDL